MKQALPIEECMAKADKPNLPPSEADLAREIAATDLYQTAKGFSERWRTGDPGLGGEPLTELFMEAISIGARHTQAAVAAATKPLVKALEEQCDASLRLAEAGQLPEQSLEAIRKSGQHCRANLSPRETADRPLWNLIKFFGEYLPLRFNRDREVRYYASSRIWRRGMPEGYLFSEGSTLDLARQLPVLAMNELKEKSENVFLSVPMEDVISKLVAKYRPDLPTVDEGGVWIEEEERTYQPHGRDRYDVFGDSYGNPEPQKIHVVMYHLPFRGDRDLFRFQPSRASYPGPQAAIMADDLVISLPTAGKNGDQLNAEFGALVKSIKEHLATAGIFNMWRPR